MLRNTDVARFVTSLLPSALKDMRSHRALLAFNAATLHALVTRSKSLNEGTLAYLLPALLEPLQRNTQKDAIVSLPCLSIRSIVLMSLSLDHTFFYRPCPKNAN